MSNDAILLKVFSEHTRHITNLRRILKRQRLALLLGAGTSAPLKFPEWKSFIDLIAKHPLVSGERIMQKNRDSNTSSAQMLFQHFRRKRLKEHSPNNQATHDVELLIKGEWRAIIHEKLYAKRPLRDDFVQKHPYLKALLAVVRGAQVVVNFNFDNVIEKGLLKTRDSSSRERGYDTTWRSCIQGRSGIPLIYHPNGYLPDNLLEGPSEELILSEDSFADQLIDSMAGYYSSLLHQLSQNTALLLGISLKDSTLKHHLRQHARINPGHLHYHIAYKTANSRANEQQMAAVQDANFEVYNLITLFLSNVEIKALCQLLTLDDEEMVKLAGRKQTRRKFVFYITGVPGIGKSTVVSNLSSLDTYDEWVEERPSRLAKKWTSLTEKQRVVLDKWVAGQFAIRNYRLSKPEEGIHILDRCPLDPLTFNRRNRRKRKAALLQNELAAINGSCIAGQVILLTGDPPELERRAKSRHKEGSKQYFAKMQSDLEDVYSGIGVQKIPTHGLTVLQVVKRIARQIHLGEYEEFECSKKLNDCAQNIS